MTVTRFIWLSFLLFIVSAFLIEKANAATPAGPKRVDVHSYIPANFFWNKGLFEEQLNSKWPAAPYKSFLAAQIEQETCVSLTNSKCWTERAELKTSRELGWGFGQFTIAYNKDGSERFNAFKDVKRLDKELAAWEFENRFDRRYNMMAFVVRSKSEYSMVSGAKNALNQSAFAFAGYNGGRGGVLSDRRLCRATTGCDSSVWFDNVEHTSYKQKVAQHGYGKSFFDINREYVRNVIFTRGEKYGAYFNELVKPDEQD